MLPDELKDIIHFLADTQQDLTPCGPAVRQLLGKATGSLLTGSNSHPTAATSASALLQLADDRLLAYPYKDVPLYWLRLYTDATILLVVSILGDSYGSKQRTEADWLALVRKLDLALIVAGGAGPGRRDLVFDLLARVQQRLSIWHSPPLTHRPAKRVKLSAPSSPPQPTPIIAHPIIEIEPLPPMHVFRSKVQKKPLILRSYIDPLVTEKWSSVDYLAQIAGRGRVVPIEMGGDYTHSSWGQEILPFTEFLDSLVPQEGDQPRRKLYLAQHNLFSQLPNLLADLEIPDYVYSAPDPPLSTEGVLGVDYKPPETEDGYLLNAWLGPSGTVSPAHTDPFYNCFLQVVGRKYLWVAPPSTSPHMYPFSGTTSPPSSPSSSSSSPDLPNPALDAKQETSNSQSHLMTNTSRLPLSPFTTPSRDEFPDFDTKVAPFAQQAVLEEGDVVFLPPGWWHCFVALDGPGGGQARKSEAEGSMSFSVSIWF